MWLVSRAGVQSADSHQAQHLGEVAALRPAHVARRGSPARLLVDRVVTTRPVGARDHKPQFLGEQRSSRRFEGTSPTTRSGALAGRLDRSRERCGARAGRRHERCVGASAIRQASGLLDRARRRRWWRQHPAARASSTRAGVGSSQAGTQPAARPSSSVSWPTRPSPITRPTRRGPGQSGGHRAARSPETVA